MLTYYAIFSLFPFVLSLVTLTLLILPTQVLDQAFRMVAFALPASVGAFALDQLHHFETAAASGFAIFGFVIAMWSASRGVSGLSTALNNIAEVQETRSWVRLQLVAIGTTLLVSGLVVIAFSLLLFGPLIGHFLMDRFGLGSLFDWAYSVGRWVGAAALILIVRACLFYFLPNTKTRSFPVFTPGAVIGTAAWLAASRLLILYTDNFGNYDKTYGTLGGVIVFMTWLWISCFTLLIGGEIDDAIDVVRRFKHDGSSAEPTKEIIVERSIQVKREAVPAVPAITDLAKRVGDDLSQLAKDHFELARLELSSSAKTVVSDGAAVLLGGVVTLIGLAMLCLTAVVAAAPLVPALWLRLLLGAFLYLLLGGGLCYGFVRKLRGEPVGFKKTRREAKRTVRALKAQVQNG